jgi:hypothetical protein
MLLVLRVIMLGATQPCVCIAWSLVKHRGNFVLASVRCEALMVKNMKITVFWDVTIEKF